MVGEVSYEFFEKIVAFRMQKTPLTPEEKEAEILERIREKLPREMEERFHFLIAKRDLDDLSDEEYKELLSLTEKVEAHDLKRLRLMTELYELLSLELPQVVEKYKLQPQSNV